MDILGLKGVYRKCSNKTGPRWHGIGGTNDDRVEKGKSPKQPKKISLVAAEKRAEGVRTKDRGKNEDETTNKSPLQSPQIKFGKKKGHSF